MRKRLLESALCATEAVKAVGEMRGLLEDSQIFRKELKTMVKVLHDSVSKLQRSLPELPKEFQDNKPIALGQGRSAPRDISAQSLSEQSLSRRKDLHDDLQAIRKKLQDLEVH